jgi:hypothetical protein
MMETNFTPGPWVYSQEDQQVHLPGDPSKLIADVRGWGWLQKLPEGAAIQNANGKIIAAAPDLLAACHEMLTAILNKPEWCNLSGKMELAEEAITQAIQKATQ